MPAAAQAYMAKEAVELEQLLEDTVTQSQASGVPSIQVHTPHTM